MSSHRVEIKPYATISPVGITNQGQTYVPVRLDQADSTWTVTQQHDQIFLFTISNLTYTGINVQQAVVASNDASRSVEWQINHQPHCMDESGNEAHTIQVSNDESLGWTLIDQDQIVVATLNDVKDCDFDQLFYFT